MVFAILKLSYNNPGETTITGGICGSGFFVSNKLAVTAHHVLNSATLSPNIGNRFCQLWLLSRNGSVVPFDGGNIEMYPSIVTSIIRFEKPLPGLTDYAISSYQPKLGDKVIGKGHIGNSMPQVEANWVNSSLVITAGNLQRSLCDRKGNITGIQNFTVNANDVKIKDVRGFELSFGSRIGMSGGPLLHKNKPASTGICGHNLAPAIEVEMSILCNQLS